MPHFDDSVSKGNTKLEIAMGETKKNKWQQKTRKSWNRLNTINGKIQMSTPLIIAIKVISPQDFKLPVRLKN